MFPPSTKTLIADDMLTMRKMVRRCLEDLGVANVTEAKDGAEAYEKLENAAEMNALYELLVTDWNMPNLKGIDLVKKIRANPKLATIPIMFVTAENTMEQVKAGIAAGATHYVVKPFSPATFHQKLEIVYQISEKRKLAAQAK
jgi:two-component system chemotaxis response regulator CheY